MGAAGDDEKTPGVDEQTPGADKPASDADTSASAADKPAPADEKQSPGSSEPASAADEPASADEKQSPGEGKPASAVDKKTLRNAALLAGVLIVAGFGTGFAGGFINGPGVGTESGTPRTLQQLATATGCKPAGVLKNQSLQQGNCATKRGRFVILTFGKDQAQKTWLRGAKDYGGKFLVGTRWVIAGTGTDNVTVPMLEEFRSDLGGQIQSGRNHKKHPVKPHK